MLKLLNTFRKTKSQETPYKLHQVEARPIYSPLLVYRKNIASQDGEDGIIEKIFSIMPFENKYCIEFGARNRNVPINMVPDTRGFLQFPGTPSFQEKIS